jgi:hypothetical protein
VPCEVPNPIPCDVNETHASYDAAYIVVPGIRTTQRGWKEVVGSADE